MVSTTSIFIDSFDFNRFFYFDYVLNIKFNRFFYFDYVLKHLNVKHNVMCIRL